jgi:hypothetical protein
MTVTGAFTARGGLTTQSCRVRKVLSQKRPELPSNGHLACSIGPELDLHAFAPADIPSVVEEYIRRRTRPVFASSGSCTGEAVASSAIVQSVLERHPLVAEFRDAMHTCTRGDVLSAEAGRAGPGTPFALLPGCVRPLAGFSPCH